MKKILMVLSGVIFMTGCQNLDKTVSSIQGNIKGMDRTVTLIDKNGKIIKTYKDKELQFDVYKNSNTVSIWLGSKNKKVVTSATFIIEDN